MELAQLRLKKLGILNIFCYNGIRCILFQIINFISPLWRLDSDHCCIIAVFTATVRAVLPSLLRSLHQRMRKVTSTTLPQQTVSYSKWR